MLSYLEVPVDESLAAAEWQRPRPQKLSIGSLGHNRSGSTFRIQASPHDVADRNQREAVVCHVVRTDCESGHAPTSRDGRAWSRPHRRAVQLAVAGLALARAASRLAFCSITVDQMAMLAQVPSSRKPPIHRTTESQDEAQPTKLQLAVRRRRRRVLLGYALYSRAALPSLGVGQCLRQGAQTRCTTQRRPRRPPKLPHLWPPKLLHPGRGDLTH